jgi:hypothetical protein
VKPKRNPWAQAGEYMSLAFLLPASTFTGYAIGYLLDKAFGTRYLSFVFLIVGIAAGFVELLRKLLRKNGYVYVTDSNYDYAGHNRVAKFTKTAHTSRVCQTDSAFLLALMWTKMDTST